MSTPAQLRSSHLRRRTEIEEGRSAPRSDRGAAAGQARRLAEGTRAHLGWLHGQSWRRLAPTLGRFARAGWTPRDVRLAVRDALAARGWTLPAQVRFPAAFLATLLRDLDPADRPSVTEDAYEAAQRAAAAAQRASRRAWVAALRTSCAHGVPAGNVPDTVSGTVACLDCRRITR